jgi:salicylate hydroxylase
MRSWGIDRVSLLGDACHPTLPFMAQGAAMAIEDAIVLSNCLSSGADVVAALQHYEDLRKGRTASVQRGSRRNAKVFHLSGLKAWVRDRAAARAGKHSMDRLYRYDPLIIGLDAATND